MKYSAVIFALAAAAVAAPSTGTSIARSDGNGHENGDEKHEAHEGKCVFPTFTDEHLVVIGVDVSVLGLVDVNAEVAIDLVTVRRHYPECRAFYCCPNLGEPGKRIHPSCHRWE